MGDKGGKKDKDKSKKQKEVQQKQELKGKQDKNGPVIIFVSGQQGNVICY